MSNLTNTEKEVAELILNALNLEDITVADIDPEAALFNDGLGLDSIDALELAMAITQKYGFQLKSDDSNNAKIFSSLRNLTDHILAQRKS
ncbi:MAG: phosphopantetheine-binding protein [Gammaproteobacteria bacterium]|nr:phosphopantetheine-binding protein [Gammaproteobacteria bacterium]